MRVPRLTTDAHVSPGAATAAIVDDLILSTARRLHRRRPRVRDRGPGRRSDARAMGQRTGKSQLRTVVSESGQATRGDERALVSPDAVAQRRNRRGQRRSNLHPRRGNRKILVTQLIECSASDDVAPTVTRHGFGYSVFGALRTTFTRSSGVRRARRAIKFRCSNLQPVGAAAAIVGDGYVEWVLGDLRTKSAMHVTTESTQVRRGLRAQCVQHRVRGMGRIFRPSTILRGP